MNERIRKILEETVSETFEGLAFMFGFPEDNEVPVSENNMVFAQANFEGAFSGRLMMAVSRQTVMELAVNMLGLEDEDSEISLDDQADALKEAINVICGNFLPAIGGKDVVFDIHPPEILPDTTTFSSIPKTGLVATARLSIEDAPCQLSFYMDEENPQNFLNPKQ